MALNNCEIITNTQDPTAASTYNPDGWSNQPGNSTFTYPETTAGVSEKTLYIKPKPGFVVRAKDFTDYTIDTFPGSFEWLDFVNEDFPISFSDTTQGLAVGNLVKVTIKFRSDYIPSGDTILDFDIDGSAIDVNEREITLCLIEDVNQMWDIPSSSVGSFPSPAVFEVVDTPDDVTVSAQVYADGSPTHSSSSEAADQAWYFTTKIMLSQSKYLGRFKISHYPNFNPDNPNFTDTPEYYYGWEGEPSFNQPTDVGLPSKFTMSAISNEVETVTNSVGEIVNYIASSEFDLYFTDILATQLAFFTNPDINGNNPETGAWNNNWTTELIAKARRIPRPSGHEDDDDDTPTPDSDDDTPIPDGPNTEGAWKPINNIVTNFASTLNTKSEYLIPPAGVTRGRQPIVRVIGSPGAQFTVTFKETGQFEIPGAGPKGSSTPSDVQLDGGTIPDMPTGTVKIGGSGEYKFLFPTIDSFSEVGWKEFEMEVTCIGKTFMKTTIKKNTVSTVSRPGKLGSVFNYKFYQYPNVYFDISGTKGGTWSYVTNYNVTDIETPGKKGDNKWGVALGDIDPMINIDFEVRIEDAGDGGTSFSLNEDVVTIQAGATWSRIKKGLDQLITPTYNVRENGDIVTFSNIKVKIGAGESDSDTDFVTLTGRASFRRFGIQDQTYTIAFDKIFTNS